MAKMFFKLTDIDKNIDKVKELYENYLQNNKKLDNNNKIKEEYEKNKDNSYLTYLIHMLDILNKESRENDILLEEYDYAKLFFKEHEGLEEYYKAIINIFDIKLKNKSLLNIVNNDYAEYFVLNKNGKRFIVDLNDQEMIDISKYDKDFADFIIKAVKNDTEMLEITPDDLPLLMAIKEDVNCTFDIDDMNPFDMVDILSEIPHKIYIEFKKAKMTDAKIEEKDGIVNKVPFIYDSNEQIKTWDELDDYKKQASDKEYWQAYYSILLSFGNNVEEVYKEAEDDKKEYVIDAYYYYSSIADDDTHFRTASRIINEEVLKRKYMKK